MSRSPGGLDPGSVDLASAGILRKPNDTLDAAASRRLAEASGAPDVSTDLTPEDHDRLLAEPFRLAYAGAWRRDLQARLGHRRILVGEFGETAIETRSEWLPIFLVWPTPPFEFARRTGVPRPVFALRLIDLEAGRIDAEFFAMMPGGAARPEVSETQLEAALGAMGLRGDRR